MIFDSKRRTGISNLRLTLQMGGLKASTFDDLRSDYLTNEDHTILLSIETHRSGRNRHPVCHLYRLLSFDPHPLRTKNHYRSGHLIGSAQTCSGLLHHGPGQANFETTSHGMPRQSIHRLRASDLDFLSGLIFSPAVITINTPRPEWDKGISGE